MCLPLYFEAVASPLHPDLRAPGKSARIGVMNETRDLIPDDEQDHDEPETGADAIDPELNTPSITQTAEADLPFLSAAALTDTQEQAIQSVPPLFREGALRTDPAAVLRLDFGEVITYGDPENPLDIDAVLASVSTLDHLIAEREAAERAEEDARLRAEADQRRQMDAYAGRPPELILQRGGLASVLPAIALIAGGAWLTFTLATAETPPTGGVVALGAAAIVGLMLIGVWLSSRRWARGALFAGLTLILGAGALYWLSLDSTPPENWPVILAAPGIAALIASVLARPASAALTYTALVLLTIAASAFVVSSGAIDPARLDPITPLWPIPVGVLLILMLLPLAANVLSRKRR